MRWLNTPLEVPRRLRAIVRARESSVIVLALIVGALAGLVIAAMGEAVALMHLTFFGLDPGERLSGRVSLNPLYALLTPCLGGLLFGLATAYISRRRGTEVDPIEANALHGGRMSIRGSLIVAAQTVWSSGVGASVGLEAGYTQLASGIGSGIGRAFRLRRSDMRILLGCGAAGGVGLLAAIFGIALMRGVAACELLFSRLRVKPGLRPMLGGAVVGLLAMVSPQVMSSGHGALHLTGIFKLPIETIALIFVLKALASIVSLGSGFRGGLFFASLLLGALGGQLFAVGLNAVWPSLNANPDAYAIIGMGALSVSVIGGPLTMTFIALETTGDL